MNGMPYPYMQTGQMPNNFMPQMQTGQMPNSFMPQMQNMNPLTELEGRISRLERQVKRLENKVMGQEFGNQSDYSASPPKDSGMYMM